MRQVRGISLSENHGMNRTVKPGRDWRGYTPARKNVSHDSRTRRVAALFMVSTITVLMLACHAFAQPSAPLRVIAEWEPAVGTLISWPLGVPQQLVIELATDDQLFVLVRNKQAEANARNTFAAWGIDPARTTYIQTNVETHWPRDWGPHQVFDGSGTWRIMDFIFQGYPWVSSDCVPISSPGGHAGDNAVNAGVAAFFQAPLEFFPGWLTGGNFLVNGHETAFSTCVMIGENQQQWTEEEFLGLAEDYLGISRYVILHNTESMGIQHIDCWMKPLDEETLLVKRVPTWHEEYNFLESNVDRLRLLTTTYGRPYRIIRIDCPPYDGTRVAAYTNSLILNRKILVPLFSIPGDATAIETYQQAMPGYEVIGFPWSAWYYYDALHCRTRAIFDRHMLRMTHRRLDDIVPHASAYEVVVTIDDRSEEGLIPDLCRLVWRRQHEVTWNTEVLATMDGNDTYHAFIPANAQGTIIEYYVTAADNSGRVETLPRTAPDGFYHFTISPDQVPAMDYAGIVLLCLVLSVCLIQIRPHRSSPSRG